MLEQAAGFAFLAALSPAALVLAIVYLGSANPRRTLLFFLIGAVAMTVAVGVVLLLALHAGGLNQPHERQPRYGLRLGLGIVALGASIFVARRKPKPPSPDKKRGLLSRLADRPAPATALAAGAIVFTPSVSFIAAVQVIATAHASADLVVAALSLVVLIDVMLIWLPLLLHVAAPEATTRGLKAFDGWLRAHGRVIGAVALAVAGVALVINGATGLAG
jgi:hypothetical protein